MSLGEFKEALACITHSVEDNPSNGEYEMMYWRILYQMKDFMMLKERINDAINREVKNTDMDVAKYWMEQESQ